MKVDHLPSFFSTGDEGSFAQKTLQFRKPAILDKIAGVNRFSEKQKQGLEALKEEVLNGTVRDPFLSCPFTLDTLDDDTRQMWQKEIDVYRGRSWLDIPFYFAESFLYFKVLAVIGYFDPASSCYKSDPYGYFKNEELLSENGGLAIGRKLCTSIEALDNTDEKLRAILHNSLWGNRVDLSLFSIAEKSRDRVLGERGDNLLIDQTKRLVELIHDASRLDFILDNTGQELVSDLVAVWQVLIMSPDRTVHLHAKRHPFYVSDAMPKDVNQTIDALRSDESPLLRKVGLCLCSFRDQGRLIVTDHYFWTGPCYYPDLPSDLIHELSRADVVLLKGDINYRRTISDRKWPVSAKLEEIAHYFPATMGLLRTMKSEAIVDIDDDYAERLDTQDPDWKVNGERGIIRVVEKQ
jgi:uncharacterized protein with ATP-grasp and redox domains